MLTKKIWIVSKYPWIASLRSENANNNLGWASLPKSSGEANYPSGETVDVAIDDSGDFGRKFYVDVSSNGEVITVTVYVLFGISATWIDFINIFEDIYHSFSEGFANGFEI
jgi:hypothetical protein